MNKHQHLFSDVSQVNYYRMYVTQFNASILPRDVIVPAYAIMHQSTLKEIASLVPKTKSELLVIIGFGKAKFDKFVDEILKITSVY